MEQARSSKRGNGGTDDTQVGTAVGRRSSTLLPLFFLLQVHLQRGFVLRCGNVIVSFEGGVMWGRDVRRAAVRCTLAAEGLRNVVVTVSTSRG